MSKRILTAMLCAGLVSFFNVSGSAHGQGVVVSPSHPGDSADAPFGARGGGTAAEGAAIWNLQTEQSFFTLQAAIDVASPGDTLEVRVPNHSEGQILIDKNLTLQGATGTEVVAMSVDTGNSGDDRAWFLVDPGVDLQVRNLGFDGSGFWVYQAFRHKGTGSFENCRFRDIRYDPTSFNYQGTAIVAFGGRVDVRHCTFELVGRSGVLAFGAGVAGAVIEGNDYTGKGAGDWIDYGFEVAAGATATVLDNTVSNCRGVASVDGSRSAALLASTFSGAGTQAQMTRNTLVGNDLGLAVGFGTDSSVVDAAFNRIVGNTLGLTSISATVTAENNWWGCNAGPDGVGCDVVSGSGAPDADPWLVLGLEADPNTVEIGGTAMLTADLNQNSDGADLTALGHLPDETPTVFSNSVLGSVSPTPVGTLDGVAETLYTAGTTPGTDFVDATVDNQTVSTEIFVELSGGGPVLVIPDGVGAVVGSPVAVPVQLNKNGLDIAAVAFSVHYDGACLSFDPSDADLDGIPDAISFLVGPAFETAVYVDLSDGDGEIDIVIFDFPPDQTLPDGDLVAITLTTLCQPPVGSSILAPVVFSADPAPSFGDTLGQDVPGTWDSGSVEIFGGLRGDCNGDGFLSAGDLSACGLELFDADGSFWLDVPGSTFVGDPVGCDANADTLVDAGDVSCKSLLIFGQVCGGGAEGNGDPGGPTLRLPADLAVGADGTVVLPVRFATHGHAIQSLVFSLDFDESRLTFDPEAPNAIRFHGTAVSIQSVGYQPGDTDGELDIVVSDLGTNPRLLTDGLLLEIELRALDPATPLHGAVLFSRDPAASFGNATGQSVPGNAGEILFGDGFESGDAGGWSVVDPGE